jgi:ATP-binding cassette subfamily B protein
MSPLASFLGLLGNILFLLGHLVTPLIIGKIIELAIPGGQREELWSNVYWWIIIIGASLVAEWLVGYSAAQSVSQYCHHLREKCIAAVHSRPLEARNSGDVNTRLTSDIDVVESAMINFVVSGFTDIGRLIMVTIVLLIIKPILGYCIIIALVAYFISLRFTSKVVDRSNAQRQDSMDSLVTKVDETLRNSAIIDAYKVSTWDAGRFEKYSLLTRRASRLRTLIMWSNNFIGVVVAHGALLVILVVAAISAQDGSTSVAQVAACVIYITGAIESIILLSPAIPDFQKAGLSLQRISEVSELDATGIATVEELAEMEMFSPANISIRDVTVVMPGNKTVLKDINLEIPAGTWVTVVGPSGSGKSTVVGLATGRIIPTTGSVFISDKPVTKLGAPVRTSVVFQDSLLFNATVSENIRVGKLDATDEEVEKAARFAELHDAIAAFPEGYATVIDSSGRTISGGQRQRLALARALVRQPRLLILDEATSALDPETAAAVWRTLRRITRELDITVMAVCHQLELATDSDLLVVVEAGEVVATGSPSELSGDSGPWRTLFDAHSRVIAGDTEAIMRLLKANQHLVPKDEAMLNDLARRSRIMEAELGTQVCRRGEPMDVFILIASGRLEISDESSKFILGPGSALGGFAELVAGTVDMDAKMVTSGQLVLVPRSAMLPSLLDLMDEEPALAAAIAWLARVGSASVEELAEKIGPGGSELVELMVNGKRLRRDDDGTVSMVFGSRRKSQFDLGSVMDSL